ncbi:MAG: ABC transporter substrate-binding protein, partial [Anaerolineae bacterium]
VIEALAAVKFKSPRGEFKFDPATHNVVNPIYVRQVQKVEGALHNVVLENLGEFPDPGDDSKG